MQINVNGMMCAHCEAHVKEALEALDGVTSAIADHDSGIVTLETTSEVSEDSLMTAVTSAGYEYAGIRS